MHVLLMLIQIKKKWEFFKNKGGAGLGKQCTLKLIPADRAA